MKSNRLSSVEKGGAEWVDRRQSSYYSSIASFRKASQWTSTTAHTTQLTLRESVIPLILVTILFFIWGFVGGLGEVLNKKFQNVLSLSKLESTGLQISFFAAYAVGPLTYSGWIVRRFGYRWSFITGLCIFGIGTLLFWPSALKRSFGGFCGAAFVVGSALATLECTAFPFVAICGPLEYSEIRLNLAQAFQSTATVSALVLASYVILDDKSGGEDQADSLASVQRMYLGIAVLVFLLAFALYFAPIPEITDEELAEQARQTASEQGRTEYEEKPLRKQYKLFFGVFAAFCFTGSQISVGTFFINYAVEVRPELSDQNAAHRLAIAQAVFAAGRFVASAIMTRVKPRHLLLAAVTIVVACLGAAIGAKGEAGIAMITIEFFAKSCVFPTLFTLTLRGLGKHTKRGASFLIASIASGIVFAPAMGAAADKMGTQKAFVVPLVGAVVASAYPIWLNVRKEGGKEEMKGADEEHGNNTSNRQHDDEAARIQEGFELYCEVKSRTEEGRR